MRSEAPAMAVPPRAAILLKPNFFWAGVLASWLNRSRSSGQPLHLGATQRGSGGGAGWDKGVSWLVSDVDL